MSGSFSSPGTRLECLLLVQRSKEGRRWVEGGEGGWEGKGGGLETRDRRWGESLGHRGSESSPPSLSTLPAVPFPWTEELSIFEGKI